MKKSRSTGKSIHTKVISFRNHREYYITLTKLGRDKKFLENFFLNLEKKKIQIVKVVYLGNRRMLEKYMGLTKKYPTLVIGNSPARVSLKNASVCTHAVEGNFTDFRYIKTGTEVVGTYFADKNFENISLSGVGVSGRMLRKDFKKEAQNIYKKIDTILPQLHFSPRSIYRFWNFFGDVSRNYSSFNAVRDHYYTKHTIKYFPAATGIEASLSGKAHTRIGLEALKPAHTNEVITKIVTSDMQSEAWSYGPKFSRAMLLQFPKDQVKKLYISGTSSIDTEGRSIAQENIEENIRYVLASVAHLLKKNGMILEDLVSSYVYCKTLQVQRTFERLYANEKWNFPYNIVITNICRPNLFFEIECIASKKL